MATQQNQGDWHHQYMSDRVGSSEIRIPSPSGVQQKWQIQDPHFRAWSSTKSTSDIIYHPSQNRDSNPNPPIGDFDCGGDLDISSPTAVGIHIQTRDSSHQTLSTSDTSMGHQQDTQSSSPSDDTSSPSDGQTVYQDPVLVLVQYQPRFIPSPTTHPPPLTTCPTCGGGWR